MAPNHPPTDARSVNSGPGLEEEQEEFQEALDARRDRSKIVTFAPPHRLGWVSVVCIIINRMIGTGIYRTPSTVINGTQSVGVTLLFWFCGACAAFAGTVVYTEFGLSIPRYVWRGDVVSVPRNGGELNYLKYVYSRPKYLATCVFAVVFMLLGNVANNAIFFGEYVLVAAGIDATSKEHSSIYNPSARGIALAATTVACLIHGSWRQGGVWLNNLFAVVKVLMLLLIIIVGILAGAGVWHTNHASENMALDNSFDNVTNDTYGYSEAFLGVIFAYSGFNQANYVLGEIRHPRRLFKRCTFCAVALVSVLYFLVNVSYMIVVSEKDQLASKQDPPGKDRTVPLLFFQNTFGNEVATRILAAFMAVSSLGNIVVMTFTAARVKQEIAKEGIVPFAKFIGQSSHFFRGRLRKLFGRSTPSEHEAATAATPVGALCVHWLFTIVLIFATWTEAPTTAYRILVSLYSYTIDAFFAVMLGVGLLYLRCYKANHWKTISRTNVYVSVLAAFFYSIANAFPLVASWIPPPAHPTGQISAIIPNYPWFATPTVGWGLVGLGIVYWLSFRLVLALLEKKRGKKRIVENYPCLHEEYEYPVQFHEIVSLDWEVWSGSQGSSVHEMTVPRKAKEVPLRSERTLDGRI